MTETAIRLDAGDTIAAANDARVTIPTVAPTADVLADQVQRVYQARLGLATLEEALAKQRATFEQDNAELIRQTANLKMLVETEETVLRLVTLKRYAVSQEKDTGPGVGVRIEREVTIDRAAAFAWAKTSGQGLELNEKAVRQIALATANEDGTCGIPGATVKSVPRATIAKDLGAAIAKAAPAEPSGA